MEIECSGWYTSVSFPRLHVQDDETLFGGFILFLLDFAVLRILGFLQLASGFHALMTSLSVKKKFTIMPCKGIKLLDLGSSGFCGCFPIFINGIFLVLK